MKADSIFFLEEMSSFFKNQFFPYLKENRIDTILHLGDLVDRRKYINYFVFNMIESSLIQPLQKSGINLHVLVGNHDSYYKNTISVNAPEKIFRNIQNCTVYSDPTEIEFDSVKFLLVPWITEDAYAKTLRKIKQSSATVICGHFDIAGFEMQNSITSHSGMHKKTFQNYEMVLSGHFHNRSHKDNIYYLGAPFDMSFGDVNHTHGFYVLDTSSLQLEFIENSNKIFHKCIYNDKGKEYSEVMALDFSVFKNKYVKIIVEHKENQFFFDRYVETIRNASPQDISIIDYGDIDNEDLSDISEKIECKDTMAILRQFVDESDSNNLRDKKVKEEVKRLLKQIHQAAIEIETI